MFDEARQTPHALMQDPAFAQALRLCGQQPKTLPGGLTLLSRRIAGLNAVMLPRAEPPPDLMEQLRQTGLHRCPLILSPESPSKMRRGMPISGPRMLAWLALSGDVDENRAALHPKWCNQLCKAETRALKVTHQPLKPDPMTPPLARETAQARQRGYSNWPASLTAAFAAAAPKQTHLFSAHLNGQLIAEMLFLSHGSAATYHIGHTTSKGRETAAHNLLMWRAMGHLADRGCQRLDLGLLDARTPGLNRFKLRTGAHNHQTGGTSLIWRPFTRG